MKCAWSDTHHQSFTLSELGEILEFSVSGYRAWTRGRTADRQWLTDGQLLVRLEYIRVEVKGAYASPRMAGELRTRGFRVSKTRGERLMRENSLRACHKRRYKPTADSTHHLPVADNRLARDLSTSGPNQVWTSDITYLWTDEGWLKLAIVTDLFSRAVVGWLLKAHMTPNLVVDECTMTWLHRRPVLGLILHSDRASQYPSDAFQGRAPRIWHAQFHEPQGPLPGQRTDRNERVFGEPFATRQATTTTAVAYIEVFYNRRRVHCILSYTSPVQYLDRLREEAKLLTHQVA